MPLFLFRGGDKQDVGAARPRSWGFCMGLLYGAFGIGQGTPAALQYFQNNCLALKIFFRALKNFFQALEKNFQALEKIFPGTEFFFENNLVFPNPYMRFTEALGKALACLENWAQSLFSASSIRKSERNADCGRVGKYAMRTTLPHTQRIRGVLLSPSRSKM